MDYTERRKALIKELRRQAIQNEEVLQVMENTPREWFVPKEEASLAYLNRPLPIEAEQTISQPYIVALMTENLQVHPNATVLEIGTGSGYQAAILSPLCKHIYTIERHAILYETAKSVLDAKGYHNITPFLGDGSKGVPEFAPYDRIIVTAAASSLPEILIDQLNDPGIMILPIETSPYNQELILVKKQNSTLTQHFICNVRFVPLIEDNQ